MHTIEHPNSYPFLKKKIHDLKQHFPIVRMFELDLPWYPVALIAFVAVWFGFSSDILRDAHHAENRAHFYEIQQEAHMSELRQVRRLKREWIQLSEHLHRIDNELPGLSTSEMDVLTSQLRRHVLAGEIPSARLQISKMKQVANGLLEIQHDLATRELERLSLVLGANIQEADSLLIEDTGIPDDAVTMLFDDSQDVKNRLWHARQWITQSADKLKQRRAEVEIAKKQIVVRKSDNQLTMFENGKEIYTMRVSLGRGGATRSGEFSILDKLGTVWSFWEIWLPQWMGIYYVGSSENGIHGLPYDDSGNTYWAQEVEHENITYGCVMPTDANMAVLYNWAEVGTPVTIID